MAAADRWWMRWWAPADHAATGLTAPKTNIGAQDAAIAGLVAASALGRLFESWLATVGLAWIHSRLHAAAAPIAREWDRLDSRAARRAVAAVVVSATVVVLVLQALELTPVDPLGWLLPAACGAFGLFAVLCL